MSENINKLNILSLDLSTKPGWAFFKNSTLHSYGTLWADKTTEDFGSYPENYLGMVHHTIDRLYEEIILRCLKEVPEITIVIEETTASKNNYSQRKIEWIHYALVNLLNEIHPNLKIVYIRDGVWKNKTGARQTKEERNLNAKIARYKKKHNKKLAKLDLDKSGKAKVVGKLGPKHYALRAVKDHFQIELQRQEEDSADAILIGYAYILGVPVCDGTPEGGLYA